MIKSSIIILKFINYFVSILVKKLLLIIRKFFTGLKYSISPNIAILNYTILRTERMVRYAALLTLIPVLALLACTIRPPPI